MQSGSNYIDIHDNEVVNLNIDKATVCVDKGTTTHSNYNAGRPKRAGKPINKAFSYDAGDETNVRLQLFYNGLLALEWIRVDTDLRDFLSVFSGEETTCRIVWTGDINALAGLFRELVTLKHFVNLPEGETIWLMVNARFWNQEGNKEFGNERLGSTHPPIDIKDNLDLLVDILNPNTSLMAIRERMQNQ
jgi:hypothetical protein